MTANNALYEKAANWVGDGSDGGTIAVEGSAITIASPTKGSPFNVYNDIDLSSSYYFEGTIAQLDGNLSFGVVAKDEVHPGYKTRGMFYNGNLTNGSAAKTTAFGEYLKQGSKVGVLLCENNTSTSTTKLYFYVNGQCLGLAFEIPNDADKKKQYLPCLHVSGTAKIDLFVPAELPTERERSTASSNSNDPYHGEWKLTKAFYGPELGQFPLPDNHKIIATFEKEQDSSSSSSSYKLSIKVANVMRTKVSLTGKKLEGGFDEVGSIGPTMSTMMMPPPDLRPVEFELVGKGLPAVTKMIVTTKDGGQKKDLLLQGPTVGMEFEPYVATFDPLTSYQ